jgi:hypothetical protein
MYKIGETVRHIVLDEEISLQCKWENHYVWDVPPASFESFVLNDLPAFTGTAELRAVSKTLRGCRRHSSEELETKIQSAAQVRTFLFGTCASLHKLAQAQKV